MRLIDGAGAVAEEAVKLACEVCGTLAPDPPATWDSVLLGTPHVLRMDGTCGPPRRLLPGATPVEPPSAQQRATWDALYAGWHVAERITGESIVLCPAHTDYRYGSDGKRGPSFTPPTVLESLYHSEMHGERQERIRAFIAHETALCEGVLGGPKHAAMAVTMPVLGELLLLLQPHWTKDQVEARMQHMLSAYGKLTRRPEGVEVEAESLHDVLRRPKPAGTS